MLKILTMSLIASFSLNSFAELSATQKEICLKQAYTRKTQIYREAVAIKKEIKKDFADASSRTSQGAEALNAGFYLIALNQGISRSTRLENAAVALNQGKELSSYHKKALLRLCEYNWNVHDFVVK